MLESLSLNLIRSRKLELVKEDGDFLIVIHFNLYFSAVSEISLQRNENDTLNIKYGSTDALWTDNDAVREGYSKREHP